MRAVDALSAKKQIVKWQIIDNIRLLGRVIGWSGYILWLIE